MTLAARFNNKVNKTEHGCWQWTGAKSTGGYGSIYHHAHGRGILATHVALELNGAPRPSPNHHALHSCDNPSCVNPEHLRWGSHVENMQDMRQRGRLNTSGLKEWPKRNPKNKRHTHCRQGHLLAGENLYVSPQLKRMCAVCARWRKEKARFPRLFEEPKPKAEQLSLLAGESA